MNEFSPRKRFQIHLSTAVILSIVAGALLLANLVKTEQHSFAADKLHRIVEQRGFPFTYWSYEISRNISGAESTRVAMRPDLLVLNVLFVPLAAVVSEWFVRRRRE